MPRQPIPAPPHRPWRTTGLALSAAVLVVATAAGWAGRPQAAAPTSPPALLRDGARLTLPAGSPYRSRIAVTAVAERTQAPTLVLPALVEADPARTVAILTPLAGKVTEVLVQLGDKVAAGQALAVVASGDLAQAYADHDKAEDAYRLTRTTLDRTRALVEARGGAPKDLLQAESDNTQALAELTRATERLREIGAGAEVKGRRLLTLRAPIAGTVTTLAAAPGAFVNDPTQVLMTVANLDKVWVTANAPESETAFVTPGMAVDLSFAAYPGRHVAAQVASVGAVLEPDTRRAKVRIALANPEGAFKPNMFANATFSGTPSKGLYVPVSALLMTDDHISVFAEVAPDTYERRIVTVGREAEDQAAITAGLTAGDKVVFRGGVLLND